MQNINGFNYIFVIEDNCCLKEDISNEEYKEIFNLLKENYEKYEIFNGGPVFFDNPNKFASCFENYYFVTNAQQVQMMVYTNEGYEKILEEYDPYGELQCDQYFAQNFLQMVYKRYIYHQNITELNENNIYLKCDINKDIKSNNKFEGVDYIFWINLDRSVDRRLQFEKQIIFL